MIKYFIRRAKKEDALALHNAHMCSIREVCSKDHTPEEISGWGNRPFNEEQRIHAIENQSVWVVEINNLIEGYAAIKFKEIDQEIHAHIFGLYLAPKALGQGIGKELLNLMIAEAKNNNVNRITLESTITAHRFYQKYGFVDYGEELKVNIGGSEVRCRPMEFILK